MAWYFNCEYFLQQTLKACKRWYQIYPITRIYIWCILCKKLTCWNRKGEWEMFHFVGKNLLWWHYHYKKKERRRTKIACLKVFTNVVNWGFEAHNKAGKETLVCASFTNCNDSIFSFRESPSDCNQGGALPNGQAPDHVFHLPPLHLHLVLVHLHLLQRWLRTTPPPPPPPPSSSPPLPPGPGLLKEPLTTGGEFELWVGTKRQFHCFLEMEPGHRIKAIRCIWLINHTTSQVSKPI